MQRMIVGLVVVAIWPFNAVADGAGVHAAAEVRELKLPQVASSAGVRRLTVRDVIVEAVSRNLDIRVKRHQLRVSQLRVDASNGRFEPTVRANYRRSDRNTPPETAQEGQIGEILNTLNDAWDLGVEHRLRTGGTVGFDLTNNRSASTAGTAVSPLLYRSGVGLRFSQPLLRGFSLDLDIPQADVIRAEYDSSRTLDDMTLMVMNTVRAAELAYWEVYESLATYNVQQQSLDLAEQQLSLTRRQIAAGVLPPSDLIGAESVIAQRQLGLVRAEAGVDTAADRLREVLNVPRDEWSSAVLPVDAPKFVEFSADVNTAYSSAVAHRPELHQFGIDSKRAALDARVAGNNRLPQIDASMTYGLVGQNETYWAALGNLDNFDSRAWALAFNLTWTPLGRVNRPKQQIAEETERAVVTRKEQFLVGLLKEVRAAVRGLNIGARELEASTRFRGLAERSLDAEQRRFLSGQSSNFVVSQRQEELSRAQLSEVSAIIGYQKAVTEFDYVTGEILRKRRIELDAR